jgi:carbon storage regulator CsrA
MLVLSRKLQQQIKIGDQITVTILRVKGNTVRVGISAPRDLRVIRGELPKNDEAVNSEATIECESVITLTGDEPVEIAESADESTDTKRGETVASAPEVPPSSAAAHLPLRRIRNRYGRGPLQQVIAHVALAK